MKIDGKSVNRIAKLIAAVLLQLLKPGEAIMVLSQANQIIKAEITKKRGGSHVTKD